MGGIVLFDTKNNELDELTKYVNDSAILDVKWHKL